MNLETNNKIQKKGITLVIPNPCGNIKETKMKNSGIEWIGEIPDEWEISKTKYLTKLYTGNSIKDEEKNLYEDKADAVPYISSKDINVTFSTTNYENGMYVKHSDNSFVRALAGSTLMCIEGGSAGKKKTFLNQEVCFVNKLCCFSPIKIDSKFLFYCLNSPNYEEEFRFNISGMIGGVSVGKLNQFILPKPPKSTQQRIASYLDKKCNKIEETIQNQQQVIEKLKAYKQSLITEAVTGKVKIENGKACGEYESYKDSGVEWIGKIPSEWDTIRIKWLLNERKERSEEGKEEPLSMSQKYGLIPTKEMETIPNMASTFVGAKLTYKDDIVFNKLKAHLGVFSVSKYDGLVSPDYAVYTSTGKADLKYLEYLFKTPQCISEFKKRSTGVGEGLTRLYTGELFSIYIPFPEKKTQKNIANFLVSISTAIDTAIEQKQKLIEKLTEYKKSLIYECVTGKKEI